MNGHLRLRLMRLVKKVRGIVEASESFRWKLVKMIREETSCCRTSFIYRGRRISHSLYGLHQNPKWLVQNGFLMDSRICFATSSSYHRVNHESKRLYRVLVAEFVYGEQFVTEEIIKEGNRWPNIEVRTTWEIKIIRAASLNGGTISVYEEVRMKAS
ncbi:hypothetical protein Tco_1562020 [Tanacetum coccineum]